MVGGTIGIMSVYIVPTRFCASRGLNDQRYRDSDKQNGAKGKSRALKRENVHPVEACQLNNTCVLYDVSCMEMILLQT